MAQRGSQECQFQQWDVPVAVGTLYLFTIVELLLLLKTRRYTVNSPHLGSLKFRKSIDSSPWRRVPRSQGRPLPTHTCNHYPARRFHQLISTSTLEAGETAYIDDHRYARYPRLHLHSGLDQLCVPASGSSCQSVPYLERTIS